jgi:hypothetical protein
MPVSGVVVAQAKTSREHVVVGVVELDAHSSALVADRQRGIEATVHDPQLVQQTQSSASEIAELGVVPLALEFGDHNDGKHHFVLCKPENCVGIGQQNAGVQDVGV